MFVNGKEIFQFTTNDKNTSFLIQFRLASATVRFNATYSRRVSVKGNVYDFAVDCNAIDKSDILNIRKCLMVKINIK